MRIFDMVKFDENERAIFKRAARWKSIATSCTIPFSEEELKALVRIDDNNALSRDQVEEVVQAWYRIKLEMEGRCRDIAGGCLDSLAGLSPVAGGAALVANAKQLATDLIGNLEAGIRNVDDLLNVLATAIMAMKSVPESEDEDGAEYGNRSVDAIIVRR